MNRVNHRFFIGSALIAIPTVLVMGSLCIGIDPSTANGATGTQAAAPTPSERSTASPPANPASPNLAVQRAYGFEGQDPNAIQQVIGKQGNGHFRTRRRSGSSSNRPATDLLSGLFGSPVSDQPAELPAAEEPDWDGVPYHDVSSGRTASQNTKPLTSGPPPRLAETRTRVIRGGSSRSQASTSATTGASPRLAKQPAPALKVPKPPADSVVGNARHYSTASSSRRSQSSSPGTRTVDVRKVYGGNRADANSFGEDVPDLVPRVSRRIIKPQAADSATENSGEFDPSVPSVAKKSVPSTSNPAAPTDTAEQAIAKTTNPVAVPEADASAANEPNVAESTEPASTPADQLAATLAPQPNVSSPPATLETPQVAQSTPAYQQPVDPSTTAVPAATSLAPPPRPSFSGVPSRTVAAPHPHTTSPSDGFHPSTNASPSPQFRPLPPADTARTLVPVRQPDDAFAASPLPQDRFQPVGSGVAQAPTPHSDASYRDPYGARAPFQPRPASPRMATTGVPVAKKSSAPASKPSSVNRPDDSKPNASLLDIPGYQAPPHDQVTRHSGDNFERSQAAKSNKMRARLASTTRAPRQGSHVVASELPGIRVVTHGPRSVMIRQSNEYEIRVENRGSIDAEGVLVRALIPDWADVLGQNASRGAIDSKDGASREHLLWTIDQLPAGQSEVMQLRLMAARSGVYNLDVDWTLVPQKSVAQVKVHEPRLELAIEGPDTVVFGSSQAYKVRVLNPGDGEAPNVVFTLSPNSATPQSQQIGSIPAGKEAQFEVELTAQDLGDLKIHGLATGDLELRSEAAKTIRVSAAKIEATLAGPELKYQNSEATYSLQLQNQGDATSENVSASLRIPAGVEYLGGIESATVHQGMLTWELASLPPGASRDYQFRCRMAATGEHVLAFNCDGSAAGKAAVNLSTAVESIADLVLTVQDPVAPAPIGSEVAYEIVVRNRGSREARDVRAIAQFSHGIEPQRVEGQSGQVVTGQVLFDTIPSIGAGQEVRLRVIAEAEKAGHHRFRTEVHSGDTVLVAEEATHYMSSRSDRVSRRSSDQSIR